MLLSNLNVYSPSNLNDALQHLASSSRKVMVISGGTDAIIKLRDGFWKADELLDISRLDALRYISLRDGLVHIGSLTTYSDMIDSPIIKRYAPLLADASETIGSVQIRNRATIGGNFGTASPAADSVPPLYTLGASVMLRGKEGRREVPVEQFFLGPGRTVLKRNELIQEVYFKAMGSHEDGVYLKLGLREANAIAIVSVAMWVRRASNPSFFSDARVALGAVAPTVVRARRCEELIKDVEMDEATMWAAARAAAEDAKPITDIRGSADYRRKLVVSLTYQALYSLVNRGGRRT